MCCCVRRIDCAGWYVAVDSHTTLTSSDPLYSALNLANNSVVGTLPNSLVNLTALTALILDSNGPLDGVSQAFMLGRVQVRVLSASAVIVGEKAVQPGFLHFVVTFRHSQRLSLSSIGYGGSIPSYPASLALTYLDISHNTLLGRLLPPLTGLTKLAHLNASACNLIEALDPVTSLTQLQYGSAYFAVAVSTAVGATAVDNCSRPMCNSLFPPFHRTLDLHNGSYFIGDPGLLAALPLLTYIDLSTSGLGAQGLSSALSSLSKLQVLDLHGNILMGGIDVVSTLTSLTYVLRPGYS